MTFIIISKETKGYSASISDRMATVNHEEPKVHLKVLNNYLTRLAAKNQQEFEEEVSRTN